MNADDLDRALAEEDIVPSSGFVAAVMTAVLEEAQTPAPIPFPWTRALTGFAAAISLVLVVPAIWLRGAAAPPDGDSGSGFARLAIDWILRLAGDPDMALIAAALLLTYALVDIPRRLTSRT